MFFGALCREFHFGGQAELDTHQRGDGDGLDLELAGVDKGDNIYRIPIEHVPSFPTKPQQVKRFEPNFLK